jgi:hypothetical protein
VILVIIENFTLFLTPELLITNKINIISSKVLQLWWHWKKCIVMSHHWVVISQRNLRILAPSIHNTWINNTIFQCMPYLCIAVIFIWIQEYAKLYLNRVNVLLMISIRLHHYGIWKALNQDNRLILNNHLLTSSLGLQCYGKYSILIYF